MVFASNLVIWAAAIWCCQPFPEMYEPFRAALMNQFWLDEYPQGPTFCAIHPVGPFLMLWDRRKSKFKKGFSGPSKKPGPITAPAQF